MRIPTGDKNWWIGTDNRIRIYGLRQENSRTYINNATVVATLKAGLLPTGADVVNAESISLDYITDSDGDYIGTIADTAELTAGSSYTLVITATATIGGSPVILKTIITKTAAYLAAIPT